MNDNATVTTNDFIQISDPDTKEIFVKISGNRKDLKCKTN